MIFQGSDRPNSLYSWYVVVVLMLCYALSFIDRQILSLLVEPIKADLGLSDTEFSLLQGMAFALFLPLLASTWASLRTRAIDVT